MERLTRQGYGVPPCQWVELDDHSTVAILLQRQGVREIRTNQHFKWGCSTCKWGILLEVALATLSVSTELYSSCNVTQSLFESRFQVSELSLYKYVHIHSSKIHTYIHNTRIHIHAYTQKKSITIACTYTHTYILYIINRTTQLTTSTH